MSELIPEGSLKKQRLGRGLGSLLGQVAEETAVVSNQNTMATATPAEARIWQIGIDKLIPSQFQPRTQFQKEALEELAQSIKQNGILQPIVARKLKTGAFEIIAGERRWRAAQMAGMHEVPVLLKTLSNKETLELAIIENVQREDLNPMEEADAYNRLIVEFGLTQQMVSERVGKERATVANALRLLGLPGDVRDLVSEGRLSAGHAKVLLGLDEKNRISVLAKKASEQQLSVRALEKEVALIKNQNKNMAPVASVMNRAIVNVAEDLQKILGTKVVIDYKDGKGKLSITFYSDEELNSIIEKVKTGCRI